MIKACLVRTLAAMGFGWTGTRAVPSHAYLIPTVRALLRPGPSSSTSVAETKRPAQNPARTSVWIPTRTASL